MLRSISWQNFFAVTGILLGVYYAIIATIYYWLEMAMLFRSPKEWKDLFRKTSASKDENITDDFFASASILKKEVDQMISDAYYRKTNKEDLFSALREHLENYTRLPENFRIAINNHIQSTGEKAGSFHFTAEELSMLWRAGE